MSKVKQAVIIVLTMTVVIGIAIVFHIFLTHEEPESYFIIRENEVGEVEYIEAVNIDGNLIELQYVVSPEETVRNFIYHAGNITGVEINPENILSRDVFRRAEMRMKSIEESQIFLFENNNLNIPEPEKIVYFYRPDYITDIGYTETNFKDYVAEYFYVDIDSIFFDNLEYDIFTLTTQTKDGENIRLPAVSIFANWESKLIYLVKDDTNGVLNGYFRKYESTIEFRNIEFILVNINGVFLIYDIINVNEIINDRFSTWSLTNSNLQNRDNNIEIDRIKAFYFDLEIRTGPGFHEDE